MGDITRRLGGTTDRTAGTRVGPVIAVPFAPTNEASFAVATGTTSMFSVSGSPFTTGTTTAVPKVEGVGANEVLGWPTTVMPLQTHFVAASLSSPLHYPDAHYAVY